MKKVTMLCMLAASALAFQACNESKSDKASEEHAEAATDQAKEMNDSLQTVDEKDAEFAMKAAGGGMYEVEVAKLAEQKASNAKVKEFAAMMIKDHGKANEELMSLASAKGITLPATMDEDHQKHYNDLKKLSGKDFDKKYVELMKDDHDKDQSLFNTQATEGKDAELKEFATKTSGVIQQHLNHIKQISESMK
ncbi:DUF4142 domain-containing protein [Siphonobacter curvatus]|uniref:DUF305 domain-containing protein n=1 Tax=Siphonobacter curvatus TaxID=2094562 RepID=A0A2S7IM40_9BACT|nr:DUF4142 domain-containing protein [Siphonobacter curvatus]PQA58813.1 DUF305 domain-containing protein [Siphonobacter curvatus]